MSLPSMAARPSPSISKVEPEGPTLVFAGAGEPSAPVPKWPGRPPAVSPTNLTGKRRPVSARDSGR